MSDIAIVALVCLLIGNVCGFAFALVWLAHRGYGKPGVRIVPHSSHARPTPYSAYQLPTRKMEVRR